MAKVPEAGKVKTRLQPFLTPEQSAKFADCLLQDTIGKAKSLENKLIVAYSPPEQWDYFDRFHNLNLIAQDGKDLGERMFNAFKFAVRKDSDSIVMIGTDSPTLPPTFIEKAFEYLEKTDAVLGKTEDGGFYLIGLRKLDLKIFADVEWSSEKTFEQTKRNLEKLGFSLAELPIWYDVDEPKDLERLKQDDLLQQFAPKTVEWITTNSQFHHLEVDDD
ncbi:MAG TPA: TIGR04282 family arsenosugar biosynthesis glycosyltransferase [Pyrinomonadaceae bacterium]|nr:TIGR04282 family arsenosugar biosynthesis glycosyltransferase [Pyrinomonadaceae bacterium]